MISGAHRNSRPRHCFSTGCCVPVSLDEIEPLFYLVLYGVRYLRSTVVELKWFLKECIDSFTMIDNVSVWLQEAVCDGDRCSGFNGIAIRSSALTTIPIPPEQFHHEDAGTLQGSPRYSGISAHISSLAPIVEETQVSDFRNPPPPPNFTRPPESLTSLRVSPVAHPHTSVSAKSDAIQRFRSCLMTSRTMSTRSISFL